MELVSESPTELYYHKNPLSVRILGGAFFIVGVIFILLFGWKTHIQCNCVSMPPSTKFDAMKDGKGECGGWCNISKTNLWMFSEQRIPTRNIRAALLDGGGATYRVVLLLTKTEDEDIDVSDDRDTLGDEEFPLLHYNSYSGYQSKRRLVTEINAIVKGVWKFKEGDIVIDETQDERWLVYIVAVIFMSVLALAVLIPKKEVCFLDKTDNVLAIIRSTAFSRREEVYALNEVSLVELHRNTQDRKTEYKVFFELEPSRSSLNSVSSSSSFTGGTVRHVIIETGNRWISMCEDGFYHTEEEAQKVCHHMRKFLGIPSLDDLMREKKKT